MSATSSIYQRENHVWMNGWMDGWMDRPTDQQINGLSSSNVFYHILLYHICLMPDFKDSE